MKHRLALLFLAELITACNSLAGEGASATVTPISIPVITATWTPAPTVTPTRAPTETSMPLVGCEMLTRAEIESVIGPLDADPQANPSVGEGVGYFEGCIYMGATAFATLSYGPTNGITAHAYYEQSLEQSEAQLMEPLADLGEAAFWIQQDEASGQLYVRRGATVLNVFVTSGAARANAIRIAQLALTRLP